MRLRPLEAMNLIAVSAISILGLGLVLAGRLQHPAEAFETLAALTVGVLVVALLARDEDRLSPPLRVLVNFYGAAFLPILFNVLGPFIEALWGGPRDDLLIAADRALFGVDVTIWMERFVTPLANSYFALAYTTYYFFALTLGGLLWAFRRADGRRFFFTIVLAYHVSYAGYFVIPGLGPRFTMADRQTVSVHDTGVSKAVDDTLNWLERTKYDVFPSGHTMIAVATLLVAWKRFRKAFWFFLPVAVSLVISTVYCRYHYAIDVIAGIALAPIVVPLGDGLYDRLMERRA
ncbi:MAG: phosphatase PAP2 family protein [Thermoanaerobaculia bacterium]